MERNRAWRTTTAVVAGLVVIASLGVSKFIQGYTLVDWWKPVIGSALFALMAAAGLHGAARRLTGTERRLPNYMVAAGLLFAVACGAFYAVNYYGSDAASKQHCSVSVIGRYCEEHYRVRRISRHTAVKGEKYYVYAIRIELPDGRIKRIELPVDEYVKIRKGQSVRIDVEKGLFGVPVIKELRPSAGKHKRWKSKP